VCRARNGRRACSTLRRPCLRGRPAPGRHPPRPRGIRSGSGSSICDGRRPRAIGWHVTRPGRRASFQVAPKSFSGARAAVAAIARRVDGAGGRRWLTTLRTTPSHGTWLSANGVALRLAAGASVECRFENLLSLGVFNTADRAESRGPTRGQPRPGPARSASGCPQRCEPTASPATVVVARPTTGTRQAAPLPSASV
jgi:hypothetical protein